MDPDECDPGEWSPAGLSIDGGDGRYFAIAWDDLLRFLVPPAYEGVIEMLVDGGELTPAQADVIGFGAAPETAIDRLLAEATGGASGRSRGATRRLGAWAVLR